MIRQKPKPAISPPSLLPGEMMNNVRLSRSSVGAEESAALARVIEAGYLGMGEEVRLFEEEIAAMIGGDRHVVCVSTGTAALHLALSALDIGPGQEVLVPSITYVASFQAVSATGAKPVACDVREGDVFLDLKDAERRLTADTRAIMPVHYGSSARGLEDVRAFARNNDLRVIEDAAHAFGCTRNGIQVGADGDIICFSFDGIKNITSGEGGAIVTGDLEVAQRARDGRLLGVEKDTEARYAARRTWTFDVHHQGFRYHMSNLMAAVGREQLKKLPRFSERRRVLASRYCQELGQLRGLTLLDMNWNEIIPHIFVVRVRDGQRDALGAHLKSLGIEWGLHYQPNHQLSFFRAEDCPVSDQLGNELLSIPLHAELTDAEQSRVIAAVRAFSGFS
jgi:dTDP-4-amino-4,6-dideoxygalactose transaminase